MERRAIELTVGGQRYKVVSTSDEAELLALAAEVDSRVRELTPRSRAAGPQALVLAAIALAHELEIERKKRQELEGRTREALTRMLGRIDLAMGEERPSALMS